MLNIKRIEFGSHKGDFFVENEGVKKILSYSEILDLQKELEKKVEESKAKVEPIEFQSNDIEPTIADVQEAPVKEEVVVTEEIPIKEEVEPIKEEVVFEEPKPKKKSRKSKK